MIIRLLKFSNKILYLCSYIPLILTQTHKSMKKNLLTLALLFFFSNIIFAQTDPVQQVATNATGSGLSFDITSLLIGLVVGGVIGYFVGSRKPSN